MILVCVCVCVCVCCFLIARNHSIRPPVILVILYATRINRPEGVSMMHITITSDQTRQGGHTLSTCAVLPLSFSLSISLSLCLFIILHITA